MTRGQVSRIRLVVCADDYGLTEQVNEAVLQLVVAGRISALSCLVDAPACRSGANQLQQPDSLPVDVGLHLNLTEWLGQKTPTFSLSNLIGLAYGGLLDMTTLRQEIRRQLGLFEDIFGKRPDHVDGHQHVHQLPGVRQALLSELEARYPECRPWVRSGRSPARTTALPSLPPQWLKPAAIGALGAMSFTREAKRRGFPTNRHLLGVYAFNDSVQRYAQRLGRWVTHAQDSDLLMCHPGMKSDKRDPISMARRIEFTVLSSDEFTDVLAAHGVTVSRLGDALCHQG